MSAGPAGPPLVVNGWAIYAHPLFLSQIEKLITEVESCRRRDPDGWRRKNCTKRLAAILRLMTEVIPSDPASPAFRLGGSLGTRRGHWRRAKFFQQYRLFFRFSAKRRVIVLVWVNDERNLRAYGSRHDAYLTFRRMLERGDPPEDLDALLAQAAGGVARLSRLLGAHPQDR
ncbi:MAG: hypothetical protein KatS3mg119_1542 [Rhodothalassiaceae bacterium]|nr:MAG: hypothetical protein KatS3mg119_1542 [Rhodothalassiaceae bacterium]